MLKITIPDGEFYDEKNNRFITVKGQTISLEHSLVSISKWEQKWKKPFLHNVRNRTYEESLDYIRCMTITQNVPQNCYYMMDSKLLKQIYDYIDDPMTATTIHRIGKANNNRTIMTSERIYGQMIRLGIPFECQKWHLNRLLMLIKVCDIDNGPKQKLSRREALAYQRAQNEARKKKYNTTG